LNFEEFLENFEVSELVVVTLAILEKSVAIPTRRFYFQQLYFSFLVVEQWLAFP
jgi:hypothetical protein